MTGKIGDDEMMTTNMTTMNAQGYPVQASPMGAMGGGAFNPQRANQIAAQMQAQGQQMLANMQRYVPAAPQVAQQMVPQMAQAAAPAAAAPAASGMMNQMMPALMQALATKGAGNKGDKQNPLAGILSGMMGGGGANPLAALLGGAGGGGANPLAALLGGAGGGGANPLAALLGGAGGGGAASGAGGLNSVLGPLIQSMTKDNPELAGVVQSIQQGKPRDQILADLAKANPALHNQLTAVMSSIGATGTAAAAATPVVATTHAAPPVPVVNQVQLDAVLKGMQDIMASLKETAEIINASLAIARQGQMEIVDLRTTVNQMTEALVATNQLLRAGAAPPSPAETLTSPAVKPGD